MTEMRETVVAAAVQVEGVTFSLPQPARHAHVLWALRYILPKDEIVAPACQGFLTSSGRFVNRVEALHIAHRARQPQLRPMADRHPYQLFSEDLW